MKKRHLTAHDRFTKVSLEEKPIAEDFFKAHLPQKIQKLIDWETLELQSGSFIDEDYRSKYTDILYRVDIDHQAGYLFTLVEHQSTPDRLMPFRLWNYLCKIWDRHLKQCTTADKESGKKIKSSDVHLPLIFPLTIYHGRQSPYPFSMDLFDLFQKKALARDILLRPFPLLDLTITPDDEILRHQHAALMELVQKYAFQQDMQTVVKQLKQHGLWALFHHLGHGQYLLHVVEYMCKQDEAASPEVLLEALKDALPNDEETVMTVAEQLQQRAVEKRNIEIAETMLADNEPLEKVARFTGLPDEVLDKLQRKLKQ